MDCRKELLELLSAHGLTRDEMLSVAVAVANKEHACRLTDYLRENPSVTVDGIFQKAGEIAFGKNS